MKKLLFSSILFLLLIQCVSNKNKESTKQNKITNQKADSIKKNTNIKIVEIKHGSPEQSKIEKIKKKKTKKKK